MLCWLSQYRAGTLPPTDAIRRAAWVRILPLCILTMGFLSGVSSLIYWSFIDPKFWGVHLVLVQLFSTIVAVSCALVGCAFLAFLLATRRRLGASQ